MSMFVKRSVSLVVAALLGVAVLGQAAWAEKLNVSAVLAPKQQMKLNFKDGSKRFVLLVKREGKAGGDGLLGGAAVTEYGMHDITPGVGGDPQGFLEFVRPNGDTVYIKWVVRAVFVPNPGGKPKFKLLDYGHWEVAGATGKLAGLKGVGTMTIKAASKTDRRFTLVGDLAQK